MFVFESLPEGRLALDTSRAMSGDVGPAYIAWSAVTRAGFVFGARAFVSSTDYQFDHWIESRRFSPMTGSDDSANQVTLLSRLRGVCHQVSEHPDYDNIEDAVLAVVGGWLRAGMLTVSIVGVLDELAWQHLHEGITARYMDHIITLFETTQVDAELLALSCTVDLGIDSDSAQSFAAAVAPALSGFIPSTGSVVW